jgi:hypothetical protein
MLRKRKEKTTMAKKEIPAVIRQFSKLAPIYGTQRARWDEKVSADETKEFEKIVEQFEIGAEFRSPIQIMPGFEELLQTLDERF